MRLIFMIVFLLTLGVSTGAVVQSGSSLSSASSSSGTVPDQRPIPVHHHHHHRLTSKDKVRGRGFNGGFASEAVGHAAFAIHLYAAIVSRPAKLAAAAAVVRAPTAANRTNYADEVVDVAFSPLSIASLLHALAEGANGTTASEIYAALNVSGTATAPFDNVRARESRHRWMSTAVEGLVAEPTVSMATKIFHAPLFSMRQEYIDRLQQRYHVNAEPLDFAASPDGAERAVNAWVSDATRQKIQTLVPPGTFDPLTMLVFVNALYFKAEWQTKFDETRTRLRPFHIRQPTADGATYDRAVTMMHVDSEFPYRDFRRLRFEMIELPYSSSCSMFVVLPHRGSSISAAVSHLLRRPAIVANPRRRLHNETVTVLLPRFTLDESSIDLKTALGKIGIVQAFQEGRADLSGIYRRSGEKDVNELHVSDALHKVFIEVNEKGTRASAASAIMIKGRSMSTDPIFRADRPFIYFIRHNPTASVLFMGHVSHPKDRTVLPTATSP